MDVVNIKGNSITEITPRGIRTQDGIEWELDAIFFATGFDAVDGNYKRMSITGPQGSLADTWSEGPESYLGISVHEFPNLFMILGLNGPFTNLPPTIETQVEFISDLISQANNCLKQSAIEAESSAVEQWSKTCDKLSANSLFRKTDS